MDTKARLAQANNFLQLLPHCRKLGMKVITASSGQLTLELPYQPKISGMDTVCGFAVAASLPVSEFCPTLDLRIDHMRRASTKGPIFAWAEC
jgi:acyl-coenzyme A thioesterase PaaI-like protein